MTSFFSIQQVKLLSELKISVEIRMGEVELSAEELIELCDGKLFRFPVLKGHLVTLCIGNEIIAEGKLVAKGADTFIEIIRTPIGSSEETNAIRRSIVSL